MNSDFERLLRWLRRARPPRLDLAAALAAGLVASLLNVALLVGAVALLVASARRPGLQAVLGALIVIELFAFLRSPLRFAERMSSHRLGYEAVTVWRRWLVTVIGNLDFSRWRRYATGDLLERALRDTDELQDLWLRFAIPLATTIAVMVIGDGVVVLLAPHGKWWGVATVMALSQTTGVAALAVNFGPLLRADRVLRATRGRYRGELVELSNATPELVLLDRFDYAQGRSRALVEQLRDAERTVDQRHRITNAVAPVATVVALSGLLLRPASSPVWTVVAGLLALSTFESLAGVRSALDTAVAVSAGAERLEEFDDSALRGTLDWPSDATLILSSVAVEEEGRVLVKDASFSLLPGRRLAITGLSGVGKSTLLRVIAALEVPSSGTVSVGGVDLESIDETQLRRHLTYVPSDPGLVRGFAVDVVSLGRTSLRDSASDLAAMSLHIETSTRWENLSRGETERVAIARALVTEPRIYVLDEPTSGLGALETDSVLELLAATGATFVIATHDPQVIRWCDQAMVLTDSTLEPLSR